MKVKEKSKSIIGFAKEETFGKEPSNVIEILDLTKPSRRRPEKITGKEIIGKEVIVCEARFDCPSCKKGIYLQIGKKIQGKRNED
jgi:hypothetical protein